RGNRSDIAWKHVIPVDRTRKIQCIYCQKVHHLAGTNKDVETCVVGSDELKNKILLISNSFLSEGKQPKVGEKRKENENLFKRKEISTQVTINSIKCNS
ncbi:hypothetical protein Lal_00018769, partial [Lupinus albus]